MSVEWTEKRVITSNVTRRLSAQLELNAAFFSADNHNHANESLDVLFVSSRFG